VLERIIAKEEKTELLLNIKKLSDKEQKILYLYYFKEMSMKEISKHLNITYRTAIGTKYNAVKKLRKFMN
jgi:RNA polymerase sporulation-specific sigma factor